MLVFPRFLAVFRNPAATSARAPICGTVRNLTKGPHVARKSPTKSSKAASQGSRKRKRTIHPKRTGIVWGVFVGVMTLAGGALVAGEGWRGIPAVKLAGESRPGAPTPIADGRWQAIVVHHTGSAAGSADDIARQHAAWGLGSLGYHFVIGNGYGEADGAIVQGPRWYAQEGGAHVADRPAGATPDAGWFNDNAIGICLVGNGERREFSDAQMRSLVQLVEDLQRACGIPDSAVFLHSDLADVASPGRWFPRARFALELAN